ncbi:MAG: hypothetical protein JW889_13665 [Verrucomicrobia bacterium]|nr:hypothetical protein [Verrucomicrobiota bacterium]
MVRVSPIALLLILIAVSPIGRAADEAGDEGLTIGLDQAKLTAWVLEEFPDGLPFDATGKPTDDEKAKAFWSIMADWPINVAGPATGLAPAIAQVCGAVGLPIYFTPDAAKALNDAGSDMRLFSISDSVRKTVVIIAREAGVEKTVVMPLGLIVLGPDEDPAAVKQLVAAPPQLIFLWRGNYAQLVKKAFPDGFNREEATDEDLKKLTAVATSLRCDLVVPGEVDFGQFVQWLVAVSQQTFTLDERLLDPESPEKRTIGPVECRFALFLDALNAALAPAGLAAVDAETHFEITVAKAKNTFRWHQSYWEKIHAELGEDWDWMEAPDEERERCMELVAGTRCDLTVAEPMELREFINWLAQESQMNIVIEPVVFATQGSVGRISTEAPGRFPTGDLGFIEQPALVVQPITLTNKPSAETLTAALAPLNLRAAPGGNGGLLIVPKDCTEEELEEMRQSRLESIRSSENSCHQEGASHD